MNPKVSITEAATYLGVSKQTLRNWDRTGKLKPQRNPKNKYRLYDLAELQKVKEEVAVYVAKPQSKKESETKDRDEIRKGFDPLTIRRTLSKLHNTVRDSFPNSSIVERFDELSKLLFLRALSEKNRVANDLFTQLLESQTDYAQKIRSAYKAACKEFSELVPEDFRTIRLSDSTIERCGRILESVPVVSTDVDLKGLAFEEVIRNTFEKGDNQQFFTPHVVTEFVVQMLDDALSGDICDPACGTGGFLVELLKKRKNYRKITGFEIDRRLAWTTSLNLLVHDGTSFEVRALDGGGSLGPDAKKFARRFDLILTNPPFGSDLTDRASLDEFKLGRGYTSRRRGVLFIERCLEMLRPNGRLAIVIDEGVLSLPSSTDVRELLLNSVQIEAVVSLSESAFMPYANVNTSILFLRKAPPTPKHRTFFAKAENVGRKANGDPDYEYSASGEQRLRSDLPSIVAAWKQFNETGRVDTDDSRIYGADLTFSATSADNRIDFQFHHPSRFDALRVLEKSKNPVLPLFELCSERRESLIPRSEADSATLRFTGLANIESYTGRAIQVDTPSASLKSAVKKYYPGDILFARMRPNLRKCHLVNFRHPGFTSAECVVLVPRSNESGIPAIDPELLSVLLRSDLVYGQIIHKVAGIGRPRISVKDLRQVMIPVPAPNKQRALIEAYRKQLQAEEELRQEAQALMVEADGVATHAIDSITTGVSK